MSANQPQPGNELSNIVVVLYQPQDVVNIGGVVRVMSNFGLSRLRLVAPADYDAYRVEGIAHHTRSIIDRIEFYPDLEAALADCGFVLATTARKRGTRRERFTPRAAALLALEAARRSPATPVALLFGREDSGLPNAALDDCHALVTIPTDPTNPSLNLAQAALLVAYELWLAAQNIEPENSLLPTEIGQTPRTGEASTVAQALELLRADTRLANGSERQELFEALAELLLALYPNTTETRMAYSMTRLRAILLRSAPRNDESRVLAHLFQHLTQEVKRGSGAGGEGGR